MADENPLWGAERIRGELQQLGLRVAKRTIRRYVPVPRAPRPRGQAWACDFLPVTDLTFRSLYTFFVIALASRRVVHVGVTRHPCVGRKGHPCAGERSAPRPAGRAELRAEDRRSA
jgi:putative transposase